MRNKKSWEISQKLLEEMRKQPPTYMGFARGMFYGYLALTISMLDFEDFKGNTLEMKNDKT